MVLGLELRAFTLSHSAALFCEGVFFEDLTNYLSRLALNLDSPDLCPE
jgi:hypothetical protein